MSHNLPYSHCITKGVDLLDKLVALYRPNARANKWWWPLLTHLKFVRNVTRCLLAWVPPSTRNEGGQVISPPRYVWFDAQVNQHSRCVVCRKKTRYRCTSRLEKLQIKLTMAVYYQWCSVRSLNTVTFKNCLQILDIICTTMPNVST